jgi:glycosyltransferase involved in cell wall biosynthesis
VKRIYTAVYRSWYPSYAWFGRDSGLVTEGLRSIGVDSKLVILDTPEMPQDERFLPATRTQFCDPEFWKRLNIDAVVLQGGGEAATQAVADAIKASRTKLIYRLDTDGVVDPSVDPWLFFYSKWWSLANPVRFRYIFWEERAWQRDLAKGLPAGNRPATLNSSLGKELFRYAMGLLTRPVVAPAITILKLALPTQLGAGKVASRLAKADLMLAESKIAAARIQRLLNKAGMRDLMPRVVNLPIPIPHYTTARDMSQKQNLVITAGRLEDNQKDLKLWINVVARFLIVRPDYRAVVIGNGHRYVQDLLAKYPPGESSQFTVIGRSSPEEIRKWEIKSKIFLCTSRGESMHIASAEASCAGCSIVGPITIASMQDYTSHQSGTVALSRSAADLLDALCAEASMWDNNKRSPINISSFFTSILAPEQHAQALVRHLITHTTTPKSS